mmetsp:Transcript_108839/g.314290  ORF Transcript_108839/g.314290 Transcript_108839/m.314290 type:complete len:240 (-) Transcript_108839:673-1392(-)
MLLERPSSTAQRLAVSCSRHRRPQRFGAEGSSCGIEPRGVVARVGVRALADGGVAPPRGVPMPVAVATMRCVSKKARRKTSGLLSETRFRSNDQSIGRTARAALTSGSPSGKKPARYRCSKHCSTEIRLEGSKRNIIIMRSAADGSMSGARSNFWKASPSTFWLHFSTNLREGLDFGSHAISSSLCVPITEMIWRIWSSESLPWKRGRRFNISPRTQPVDHMSTAKVYCVAVSTTSGAR